MSQLHASRCAQTAAAPRGTSDTGLPLVWVGGQWRALAAKLSRPQVRAAIGSDEPGDVRITPAAEYFERCKIAIIPETRWGEYQAITLRFHVQYILDQGSVGSCAWEAVAQMMMVTMSLQAQPAVLLNPWTGYRRTNQVDNGSDVLENTQVAQRFGLLPNAYWDRASHRWNSTPPAESDALAVNWTVDEYVAFGSELELQTWLRIGRVATISNSSYWGGGHATCCCEPRPDGAVSGPNSWGVDYGQAGWYTMPRAHVRRGFAEGFSQVGIASVRYSGAYPLPRS
jgi:hypothetical protein